MGSCFLHGYNNVAGHVMRPAPQQGTWHMMAVRPPMKINQVCRLRRSTSGRGTGKRNCPVRCRASRTSTEEYLASTGEGGGDYQQGSTFENGQERAPPGYNGYDENGGRRGGDLQRTDVASSSPQPLTVDETSPDRVPFHQRLVLAAESGEADEAEMIVLEMEGSGLAPGPRAYHALVYAYVKAGDPEGALDAIRRTHAAGLQPIAESYVVLIRGFVAADNVEVAKAVFASMQRAPVDARPGWHMLCTSLFQYGHGELAYAYVQRGKRDNWYPDLDLYDLVIQHLCEFKEEEPQGKAKQWDEDEHRDSEGYDPIAEAEYLLFTEMPSVGLTPETRHANWLLLAEAFYVSVNSAMTPLTEMAQGKWGPTCRPNTDSYNCILRGCIYHIDVKKDPAGYELLQTLLGTLVSAGLRPNKATHALFCEAYLIDNIMDDAMASWADMLKLARPGEETAAVADEVLVRLLRNLTFTMRPGDMLSVLRPMLGDRRPLPPTLLEFVPALGGRSIITAWLPAFMQAARQRRRPEGLATSVVPEEGEEGSFYEVEGVTIGPEGSVVDESGMVISLTRMTMDQLRAECIARDLPADGKRAGMMRAVKAARDAMPETMVMEVRRRGVKRQAKDKKTNEAAAAREQRKEKAKEEARRIEWTVETWVDGQLVKTELEIEVREGPEDDGLDVDDDFDDDGKAARRRKKKAELAGGPLEEWELGEVNPDDMSMSMGGEEQQHEDWWPTDVEGSEMALEILEIVEALGGSPTDADIAELAKAAEEEGHADAALAAAEHLLIRLEATQDEPVYSQRYCQQVFYHCVSACLAEGRRDEAQAILEELLEIGLEFDDDLQLALSAVSEDADVDPDIINNAEDNADD